MPFPHHQKQAGSKGLFSPFSSLLTSPISSVIAGGVMISFSAVFAKLAQVEPDVAAFYRVFVGGLSLVLVSILQRTSLRLPLAIIPWAVGAALCLSLDLAFWHRSIHLVGPGLATILINFQVFVLAIAGRVFLKEPLSARLLIAAPLALVGLWFLAGVDLPQFEGEILQGILLGLGAALWFGGYTFLVRISQTVPQAVDAVPTMAVISLFTAIPLCILCLVQGQSLAIPSVADTGWLLLYGLISQGLGWMLISRGLPGVSASVAGLAILIMPTLSFVWDILFFARPAGFVSFLGAALALTAIRLGVPSRGKTPKQM